MNLIIPETTGTPSVRLIPEKCIFEIKGNSFSDRINDVYEKVLNWTDKKLPSVKCNINFIFNFNVSNSVTYKNILIMMTKFLELQKQGIKIRITWYYHEEDEDSLAIGEDIEELFNLPVSFMKKE